MTTYIETTMDGNLGTIKRPNTPANNFAYALKTRLGNAGVEATVKEFTNEQHTNLHIQLVSKKPHTSDVVDIIMIALEMEYDFKWGYCNPLTKKLVKSVSAREKVLNIDVLNISELVA